MYSKYNKYLKNTYKNPQTIEHTRKIIHVYIHVHIYINTPLYSIEHIQKSAIFT